MVGSFPLIVSLCKVTLSNRHPTSAVSYHDNSRAKGQDEANALYSLPAELLSCWFLNSG
jgi:hypothetical protein